MDNLIIIEKCYEAKEGFYYNESHYDKVIKDECVILDMNTNKICLSTFLHHLAISLVFSLLKSSISIFFKFF